MPVTATMIAANADAPAPFALAAPAEGRVFWVTGLAGAGKSAVGRGLYERMRAQGEPAVLLDGDALRHAIAPDLGFSRDERIESGWRNGRLCRPLASQGIDVICATISMFRECHA